MTESRDRYVRSRVYRRYARELAVEGMDIPILCSIAAQYSRKHQEYSYTVVKSFMKIHILKKYNNFQDSKKLEEMLLSEDKEIQTLASTIIDNYGKIKENENNFNDVSPG